MPLDAVSSTTRHISALKPRSSGTLASSERPLRSVICTRRPLGAKNLELLSSMKARTHCSLGICTWGVSVSNWKGVEACNCAVENDDAVDTMFSPSTKAANCEAVIDEVWRIRAYSLAN